MNRLFSIVFLGMIFGLTACSGPNPTGPESVSDPSLVQNDKSSVSESVSALDALERPHGTYRDRFLHPNKDALTRQTNQKAYQVERAVWRFADDNGGIPPFTFSHRNLAGKTLVDYLPGKKLLINAFTMYRTEPQFREEAWSPGQVGYTLLLGRSRIDGFVITAFGWGEEQSLKLIRMLPLPASPAKSGPPLRSDGSGHW